LTLLTIKVSYSSMDRALNYKNILLKHGKCSVSSRSECDITTTIANKKVNAPVFCSNMVSVLNHDIIKKFDDNKWFHIWHRIGDYTHIKEYIQWANEKNLYFVSISIGIKKQDMDLLVWLKKSGYRIDSICIDVAFSYNDVILPIIDYVKTNFSNTYLIVGNGDSIEWVHWLKKYGVNAAKINIGVSKACRTREYTGFGSTTITDLFTCSKVQNIDIIGDGGLTVENNEVWIGDIAKAIRFGAKGVMSGTLFKNCIDSPAIINGYYGNASRTAKGHEHVEGTLLDNIRTNGLTTVEMIKLIEQSLKSSVSYSGGNKLIDLTKCDYQII
jgi:GMP reductase